MRTNAYRFSAVVSSLLCCIIASSSSGEQQQRNEHGGIYPLMNPQTLNQEHQKRHRCCCRSTIPTDSRAHSHSSPRSNPIQTFFCSSSSGWQAVCNNHFSLSPSLCVQIISCTMDGCSYCSPLHVHSYRNLGLFWSQLMTTTTNQAKVDVGNRATLRESLDGWMNDLTG